MERKEGRGIGVVGRQVKERWKWDGIEVGRKERRRGGESWKGGGRWGGIEAREGGRGGG